MVQSFMQLATQLVVNAPLGRVLHGAARQPFHLAAVDPHRDVGKLQHQPAMIDSPLDQPEIDRALSGDVHAGQSIGPAEEGEDQSLNQGDISIGFKMGSFLMVADKA